MKSKLVFILCASTLLCFMGCKSKGMLLRESVNDLIAHPNDTKKLSALLKLGNQGDEIQRAAVMRELLRYAVADEKNARKVLPLYLKYLKSDDDLYDSFYRRVAIETLNYFPPAAKNDVVPEVFALMRKYPGRDSFGIAQRFFSKMDKYSCDHFDEIVDFVNDDNLKRYDKTNILESFAFAADYCPRKSVQYLKLLTNNTDPKIAHYAQAYLNGLAKKNIVDEGI